MAHVLSVGYRHPAKAQVLNVAEPVGITTEGAHYHHLGAFFSVLDDFQYGMATEAGATPDVDQQQEPASK
jgi:hypothetical protein